MGTGERRLSGAPGRALVGGRHRMRRGSCPGRSRGDADPAPAPSPAASPVAAFPPPRVPSAGSRSPALLPEPLGWRGSDRVQDQSRSSSPPPHAVPTGTRGAPLAPPRPRAGTERLHSPHPIDPHAPAGAFTQQRSSVPKARPARDEFHVLETRSAAPRSSGAVHERQPRQGRSNRTRRLAPSLDAERPAPGKEESSCLAGPAGSAEGAHRSPTRLVARRALDWKRPRLRRGLCPR